MTKIKNFIHKHENLEKIALSLWAIFWIVQAKLAFGKIKHKGIKRNFKVIILGVRTIPTTNLVYFDAIFGRAFEKLGCQVQMLYCDGVLDSCDADTVFRNQKPQCFVCRNFGRFVKNSLNLDPIRSKTPEAFAESSTQTSNGVNCISYCQYISGADIKEIEEKVAKLDGKELLNYQYLGVKVGKHAEVSTIRYFLFGKFDLNDPNQVAVLRKKLVYAVIAVKVAQKVVAKEKPDAFFSLHGIYSTWGPFLDYFRLKRIDTIIYVEMLLRFGHFMFNRNSETFALVSKKEWSNFSRLLLTEEEEKKVDIYFAKRFEGKTEDHKIYENHFNAKIKKDSLLESLEKKKYLRRYVMYPNLAWDATTGGEVSKIFDDSFSWVDETIEFFKQKRDYQLIIKPHPAERIFEGCSKGIGDYIKEKHGLLPENIVLLRPEVPLRAYDLVGPDTIALVFNGFLGLELAVAGIPVVVTADVHYREAGVVYNVETLKEYLNLLANPQELTSFVRNNIKLAKKYAYFYYFKAMIKMPFYEDDKWAVMDWGIIADAEKLLDDSSPIIKICQKIINKEDIVAPL